MRISRIVSGCKFGADIIMAKTLNMAKPFQVQISLTNKCNLRCSYCYANYPERKQEELSTDQILDIIDQLAALGNRRINLVGGEPLIRKDIDKIIDHIKSKNIQCAMTSNGYFVPKRLDVLRKIDLLCISLDGTREQNDKNRGEGSFDAAMRAIELATENKIPLQVATVLTKNSIGSVKYILEMGKRCGFCVGFSTLIGQTTNGVMRPAPNLPSTDEYRNTLDEIMRLKKNGYPVLFSMKTLKYSADWEFGYDKAMIVGQNPDFNHVDCMAGRYYCIIDTNGDIYPCPSLVDVFEPLNAVEHGVKKAFEHAGAHNCKTCHIPCQTEFNLLYSLNPSVIINSLRNYAPGGV